MHTHRLILSTVIFAFASACADDDLTRALDDDDATDTDVEPSADTDSEIPSDDEDDLTTAGDDADDADADDEDMFAHCSRVELEPDMVVFDAFGQPGPVRWHGPGADPETGDLIDDGSTTYYMSSTYLALQPTPEAIEVFLGHMPGISQTLYSNPGLVAVQLTNSDSCAVARTLTVWTDEAAMMDFVTSDAHMQAAVQIGAISRGGSVVASWPDLRAAEIEWEVALERLADVETVY